MTFTELFESPLAFVICLMVYFDVAQYPKQAYNNAKVQIIRFFVMWFILLSNISTFCKKSKLSTLLFK